MRAVSASLALAFTGCAVIAGLEDHELAPGGLLGDVCEGPEPEPPTKECLGSTGDCNGRADDGCERELSTDPTNCGFCGNDCAGAPCLEGLCEAALIADSPDIGGPVAVAGGRAFWAAGGATPGLYSAPALGGAAVRLSDAVSTDTPITGIAADDESVFWMGFDGEWRIRGIRQDGVGATADIAPSGDYAFGLVENAEHLYWIYDDAVQRAPKKGGAVELVVRGRVSVVAIAIDGDDLYFAEHLDEEPMLGTIKRAPLRANSGGVIVVSGLQAPDGIAVDAKRLYWTDHLTNQVFAVNKEGGEPQVLADGLSSPTWIGVDSENVYFMAEGDLYAVSPCGWGEALVLLSYVSSCTVGPDALYVEMSGAGPGRLAR